MESAGNNNGDLLSIGETARPASSNIYKIKARVLLRFGDYERYRLAQHLAAEQRQAGQ